MEQKFRMLDYEISNMETSRLSPTSSTSKT
jgi:hypothetical protein